MQDSHGCLAHLILKWYSAVLSCIHPVFTLILAFLSTSLIHTACGYTVHDCLLVCACVSLPYGYMGTHVCGVGIHMPVPKCACLTAWVCVCAWLLCQFEEHQGTTQEEAPGAHTQKHIHSSSLKCSTAWFVGLQGPHAKQHPFLEKKRDRLTHTEVSGT